MSRTHALAASPVFDERHTGGRRRTRLGGRRAESVGRWTSRAKRYLEPDEEAEELETDLDDDAIDTDTDDEVDLEPDLDVTEPNDEDIAPPRVPRGPR